MNIDFWLGRIPPNIAGHGRVHIDGREVVEPPKQARQNEYGDKVRQRIVDFVATTGQVNIGALVSYMHLTKQSLRVHLSRLVRDERLVRIEPQRRGSGQCVVWRAKKCQ